MAGPVETLPPKDRVAAIVGDAKLQILKAVRNPLVPGFVSEVLVPLVPNIVVLSEVELAQHLIASSRSPLTGDELEGRSRHIASTRVAHFTPETELQGPRIEIVLERVMENPDPIAVRDVLVEQMGYAFRQPPRTRPMRDVDDLDVFWPAPYKEEPLGNLHYVRWGRYGIEEPYVTVDSLTIEEHGFEHHFQETLNGREYTYPTANPYKVMAEEIRAKVIARTLTSILVGMEIAPSSNLTEQFAQGVQTTAPQTYDDAQTTDQAADNVFNAYLTAFPDSESVVTAIFTDMYKYFADYIKGSNRNNRGGVLDHVGIFEDQFYHLQRYR